MTTADLGEVADHAAQAREFLTQAREHVAADHLHQASEKGWGAAAHMAKAVAAAHGWEYEKHAHFSVVLNNAYGLTGDDRLRALRSIANELHGNYYQRKRHLNAKVIGEDIESVAELLDILAPLTAPSR